ncbi:MAG: formylglycine-generating enzyme family protein [Planctomycetota bacterium]
MSKSHKKLFFRAIVVCFVIAIASQAWGAEKLPKKYTETITTKDGTKLSLDMVLIPAGTFTMGSPAGEADRAESEGPQHKVKLDAFYMCTTEVTLELFQAFYQETGTAKKDFIDVAEAQKNDEARKAEDVDTITGPTPVYGDMTMGYSKKHPAIGLSWHNAMTFCRWLAQKTGKPYRLPTEAEWEYACRAGTTSTFGVDRLEEYGWYFDNADMEPHAVATLKPNAWGLYDMQGNVSEWVHDFYSPTAYKEAAAAGDVTNPQGPKEGEVHVARGGHYDAEAPELRCAARAFEEDWWRMNDPQIPKSKWWLPQMDFIGFRVARSLKADADK